MIALLKTILPKITNKHDLDFMYTLTTYENGISHKSELSLDGNIIYDILMSKHRLKGILLYEETDNPLTEFMARWDMFCRKNKYFVSRQISAIYSEFDPTSNYDKHSTIATTSNGSTTYGEIVKNDDMGAQTNTLKHGAHDDDVVVGASKSTTKNPTQTLTTTGHNSPFEATDYTAPTDKTISQTDANNVIVENDEVTNTNKFAEYTDTSNNGARLDIETTEEHTDTTTGSNTVTEYTHGNVGVTTNTKMIEEVLQVYNFSIYDMVVNMFDSEFLLYLD